MPVPPATPPGGVPHPHPPIQSPVFFDFSPCRCGYRTARAALPKVNRFAPAFASLSWAGALASLGCPRGIRAMLVACLPALSVTIHHRLPMFPRWVPYAYQLPDLDDVHSYSFHYCSHRRLTLEHVPYDCGVVRQRRTVPVSGHKIAYAPRRRGYYGFDHLSTASQREVRLQLTS